ncbi:MAG: hypothetical protein ACR2F6_03330 [Mycobacteriales bacterium]
MSDGGPEFLDTDEIDNGGDPGPSRALIVGGCLLGLGVLVAALVATGPGKHRAGPGPQPSTHASAPRTAAESTRPQPPAPGPAPQTGPQPTPVNTAPYDSSIRYPTALSPCGGPANAPVLTFAPHRSSATGVAVTVAGSRPAAVAAGTVHALPVPRATPASPHPTADRFTPYVSSVHRIAQGTVVQVDEACSTVGVGGRVYYLPDAGSPRLLQRGAMLLTLDATGGALVQTGPVDGPAAAGASVRRVRADGTFGRPLPLGPYTALGEVPAGILATAAGSPMVALLDARSGRLIRRLPVAVPFAVGPGVVFGQSPDAIGTGRPLVAATVAGSSRRFDVPLSGYPLSGAQSQDGRYLAVSLDAPSDNWRPGPGPGSLWVLDLHAGHWQRVRGISLPTIDPAELAWSGDTLVISVASAKGSQLATWSPDEAGLVLLATLTGNSAGGTAPDIDVRGAAG